MSRAALAVALSLSLATSAFAKEKDGVTVPETVSVEGKTLKLNGLGTRVKIFFKVYVAALYLETPTKKDTEVISSDQTKRMVLTVVRDLDKNQVSEAIRDGFNKNSSAQMPALKDRLDKLSGMFTDVKKGQKITLTYSPGKGTYITDDKGGDKGVIPGKDFADALFSVWLGKQPVDDGLKKDLLAGE